MITRIRNAIRRALRLSSEAPTSQPELVAYRCDSGEVERLHRTAASATPLPDTLVIPPGCYQVDGEAFDLRRDGTYRFYRLGDFNAQRIVCHPEVDAFLGCAGYLWVYGFEDERRPLRARHRVRQAAEGGVVLSCTNLAALCVHVCARIGIEARQAALWALGSWNGSDDGHTLVELRSADTGWIAYDPTFHSCFRVDDRRLNVAQLCETVRGRQRFTLERLPGNAGHSLARKGGYDYAFWIDERMLSETRLIEWYDRVARLPLVRSDGRYFYPAIAEVIEHTRRARALNYEPLEPAVFQQRFYSTEATDVQASTGIG